MTENVYGLLHGVDEKKRVIAIKEKRRIRFFYMPKGMFQSFMDYFRPGIYVFLSVQTGGKNYRGYHVQNVISVEKVMSPNRQKPTFYYDILFIKSSIKAIVNVKRPKLFLDFEMSMPPFRNYQNFISEIIQAGLILVDETGMMIEQHGTFIKPTFHPLITDRTERFLHIGQKEIDQGISYRDFHRLLWRIQATYRPMVYVWGKNDEIELGKMNRLHQLDDISQKIQFIDLLKMHKTYFGLKNDLGLFSAYNMYSSTILDQQKHDALQDASVTKQVFFWFQDVCNGKLNVKPIEESGKGEENAKKSS